MMAEEERFASEVSLILGRGELLQEKVYFII